MLDMFYHVLFDVWFEVFAIPAYTDNFIQCVCLLIIVFGVLSWFTN